MTTLVLLGRTARRDVHLAIATSALESIAAELREDFSLRATVYYSRACRFFIAKKSIQGACKLD